MHDFPIHVFGHGFLSVAMSPPGSDRSPSLRIYLLRRRAGREVSKPVGGTQRLLLPFWTERLIRPDVDRPPAGPSAERRTQVPHLLVRGTDAPERVASRPSLLRVWVWAVRVP